MDQGPSELSAVSLTLSAEQLILNDQFAELAGIINGSADVSGYTMYPESTQALTHAILFVKRPIIGEGLSFC